MSEPGKRKAPSLIKAYRIVKRRFANTAFSGQGARLYGGRWNSPGIAVVYTSSTISLAVLEWRAHLTQWPAPPVLIIEIEFSPLLVTSPVRLPHNWKQLPAPKANASVGDHWVNSGKSAIFKVPSAIVPDEFNYLINPSHPEFSRILRRKPRLLKVDPRLGPLATP